MSFQNTIISKKFLSFYVLLTASMLIIFTLNTSAAQATKYNNLGLQDHIITQSETFVSKSASPTVTASTAEHYSTTQGVDFTTQYDMSIILTLISFILLSFLTLFIAVNGNQPIGFKNILRRFALQK